MEDSNDSKYMKAIRSLFSTGNRLLVIAYEDLVYFSLEFANLIFDEYYKYEPLLSQALTQFATEF